MFIDQVKIEVRSGKGGDGMISFLREKYRPKGGPNGGNGGKGASIFLKANKKITTLINFRHSRTIIGPDGEKGGIKDQYGKSMEDIYVDVPVGTVVYLEPEHLMLGDLDEDGKTLRVAKGGRGGKGNACFKSSVNRIPKIAENGEPGEKKKLTLELKLLADVGLVGFPSVGKSSLLASVSSARPEIADYPFTTLEPNLGVVSTKDGRSFVMADLPGLIEGAHLGKGLGISFLRHVERCRVIVHVVSLDGTINPNEAFKKMRNELKEYGFGLDKRPVIIALSKSDEEGCEQLISDFKKEFSDYPIYPISVLFQDGIDLLLYAIADLLEKTPNFPLYAKNETEEIKVYSLPTLEKDFVIRKENDHTYYIEGETILKYYKMSNISTDEGLLKLISHLRDIGVDDELEKLGAKDGDTVILDDFIFEYYR